MPLCDWKGIVVALAMLYPAIQALVTYLLMRLREHKKCRPTAKQQ